MREDARPHDHPSLDDRRCYEKNRTYDWTDNTIQCASHGTVLVSPRSYWESEDNCPLCPKSSTLDRCHAAHGNQYTYIADIAVCRTCQSSFKIAWQTHARGMQRCKTCYPPALGRPKKTRFP